MVQGEAYTNTDIRKSYTCAADCKTETPRDHGNPFLDFEHGNKDKNNLGRRVGDLPSHRMSRLP